MKNRLAVLKLVMILVLAGGIASVKAQSLDETLSNLSSDAAKKYVAPVVDAFGSNLNSGWVTKVPNQLLGFNLNIRVIGVGTLLDEADQNFSSTGKFNYTSDQVDAILQNSGYNPGSQQYNALKQEILSQEWDVNLSGPTITGSENEYLNVEFPGATIQGQQVGKYKTEIQDVKGFLNKLSIFPSAAVQLNVGTVFGTNAAIRWTPSIDIQDLGKFSWFGIGFIHNPGIWMNNPLPVDVAVGYFYQKLEVGDIFESKATQFGVYVSKTFGAVISITPYASLTTESSETTIQYDYKFDTEVGPQTAKINFDLEGANTSALTVGLAFKLAVLNLNVDYKMAKVNTIGAGISFGF